MHWRLTEQEINLGTPIKRRSDNNLSCDFRPRPPNVSMKTSVNSGSKRLQCQWHTYVQISMISPASPATPCACMHVTMIDYALIKSDWIHCWVVRQDFISSHQIVHAISDLNKWMNNYGTIRLTELLRNRDHKTLDNLQRLRVIWGQCSLRVAAGPCLPKQPNHAT